MYKINGYYYLMIAEGGTEYGHMETIARSKHPFGPYESYANNPILSNRSMESSIHATGHADLIETQDGSWAVCLGIRPVSYPMAHHLGREVYLAPVSWTSDGWPVIGNNTHIETVIMQVPTEGDYQVIFQKTQDIIRKRIPEAIVLITVRVAASESSILGYELRLS
ncbi:beta-xylosidase [Paenibacillus sp. DS2015]